MKKKSPIILNAAFLFLILFCTTSVFGNPVISKGERFTVERKDFSIVAPTGWEVHIDIPKMSLLMQVPYNETLKYQRTIQVATFKGPRYIDEVTAKEFRSVIRRKHAEFDQAIEDFRIRNHMNVELADGRAGLLYYTEFTYDQVPLMQAHILVSSEKRHYLLTYTDVAEHFEENSEKDHLTIAWNAMTSIKIKGETPGRFQDVYVLGLILAGIVGFILAFTLIRKMIGRRDMRAYAAQAGIGVEELDDGLVSVPMQAKFADESEEEDEDSPKSIIKEADHVEATDFSSDFDDDDDSEETA